jgi:hypothetical protein
LLFKEACKASPGLADAQVFLREKIPLAKGARPEILGQFYRLPNHHRSYACALEASPEGKNLFASPAVVFKGAEPLLSDFPRYAAWMKTATLRTGRVPVGDHFPLAEGKIPGAFSLSEGHREAEVAVAVQEAHLRTYGKLARLPLPLLVHKLDSKQRDRCAEIIRQTISGGAFRRIEPVLDEGLAILTYFYPQAPLRADFYRSENKPFIGQHLQRPPQVDATVKEWCRLLVRLLYCGFMPYTPWNLRLGACMDPGNAVIDGGFCDVDSIVPIASLIDDGFFFDSLMETLLAMRATISTVLQLPSSASYEQLIAHYTNDLIEEALRSELLPGMNPDPRIQLSLHPRSLAGVLKLLEGRTIGPKPYEG